VDGAEGALGALEGAGEVGFVAGEDGEVAGLVHEGAGDVGVDAFGRGGGGEFGDLEVEESGFEAGAAVEAEVEGGEGVDEGEFEGVAGVEGVGEGVGDGGEGVVGFAEGGEVAGGDGVGPGNFSVVDAAPRSFAD